MLQHDVAIARWETMTGQKAERIKGKHGDKS